MKNKLSKQQSNRIKHQREKYTNLDLSGALKGVVVQRFGEKALVFSLETGFIHTKIRKTSKDICCGDKVAFFMDKSNENAVIEAVFPRTSILKKFLPHSGHKNVVANVDQMIIISAVLPILSSKLIDGFLLSAAHHKIKPILVFNKVDLLEENTPESKRFKDTLALYSALGYDAHTVSMLDLKSLDNLKSQLTGKSSLIVGQSGVGKSTFVGTWGGNNKPLTKALSKSSNLGQHTTSVSQLYFLDDNSTIVDSPGIRDLLFESIEKQDVDKVFHEILDYASNCHFRNCAHTPQDLKCAVQEALKGNKINQGRFDNYQNYRLQSLEKNIRKGNK